MTLQDGSLELNRNRPDPPSSDPDRRLCVAFCFLVFIRGGLQPSQTFFAGDAASRPPALFGGPMRGSAQEEDPDDGHAVLA